MNFSSTKTLVEFLHSYLNLLTRFNTRIDIAQNQQGIDFVCEALSNPLTQKDILTQSSIIFWSLLKIQFREKIGDPVELLISCLCSDAPKTMFDKTISVPDNKYVLETGILQMAKIRGFVLTMDKEIDIGQAML